MTVALFVRRGSFVQYYNFWTDSVNLRGLWRRTSLEQYRTAEPEWETVLDIDKLGQAEGESWVWKGYDVLGPSAAHHLPLIAIFLS